MGAAVEIRLTDYQERCLIALVDIARSERDDGFPRRWHRLAHVRDYAMDLEGIRLPTATRLARLGLIEFEPVVNYTPSVRATDAGIALCDSMGD